jgi:hypothetical protein
VQALKLPEIEDYDVARTKAFFKSLPVDANNGAGRHKIHMTRREHRKSFEKSGFDPSKALKGDFPESFFIAGNQADFLWDMDHVRTNKGRKADLDAYVVEEDNELYSLISYSELAAKKVMYSCRHMIPTNGLFRLAIDWSDLQWYADTHCKQMQAHTSAASLRRKRLREPA